jgi:copper(I)-binding protein
MKTHPILLHSQAGGPAVRPRRTLRPILYGFAGLLAAGLAAQAAESGITVNAPWVRFIMKGRPAAGYFTLSNNTDRQRTLVSVTSPACKSVMLHRTVHKHGLEKMVMVKDVAIAAHSSFAFAPSGYHLMCMAPSDQVKRGKSITFTLHFKDGGTTVVPFPVRGATGR